MFLGSVTSVSPFNYLTYRTFSGADFISGHTTPKKMLKRKTLEQTHMNIKLFIPEPLSKIVVSSEPLQKTSIFE